MRKRLLLLTSMIIHLNDTPGVNMRRTISKHTAINAEPHMNHQLHHKRVLLANAKTSMILMTAMVASDGAPSNDSDENQTDNLLT